MVPTSVRLHPTVIEGFRVRLARAEARAIAARMERLSAELGTRAHWLESEQCLEIRCGQAAEAG
ncbi:MAG: hypothetical protein HOQ07_03340 [Sinomonas sp.]|nr:hypothetical protein [Sinomonas sp.]